MIWRDQEHALTLAQVQESPPERGLHLRPGHAPNGAGQVPVFDGEGRCVCFARPDDVPDLPLVGQEGPGITLSPEDRRPPDETPDPWDWGAADLFG